MSEFNNTNFAKLNTIQQKIVDMFEFNNLTRPEVFVLLKALRNFKMVNREIAEKYWNELITSGDYFGIACDLSEKHLEIYKQKKDRKK